MKHLGYYSLIVTSALMVLLFSSYQPNLGSVLGTSNTSSVTTVATTKSFDLDKDFYFADERVPTENFDVRERLDREIIHIAYHHTSTILAMKRAARVFPIIEPILAEYGIPNDMKYLAVTESTLANATSGAGAKGVWQFMKSTGTHYGLEVNSQIDERNHLEKATVAACKYLKHYKEQFGSWPLATSAYNMGGPRLKKNLAEQKGTTLYDLNLNKETSRYFFRIVAHKEIMENPEKYGFEIPAEHKYYDMPAYHTVEVTGAVPSWGAFAQKHHITYRQLKLYNPWIKTGSMTNKRGKKYEVRIPY